jgi:hypothetical protein
MGEILIISDRPEFLVQTVIGNNKYSELLANDKFTIINTNDDSFFNENQATYREDMINKGIYLGHHIGPPLKVSITENEMRICIKDLDVAVFNKFFWNFVFKYILTVMSLKHQSLHVKGTTLIRDNKAYLLVGRGKSGKTTLAQHLQTKGFSCIGNTHAIIRENHIWSLNTWVRSRNQAGIESYRLNESSTVQNAYLEKIIVVDHNTDGKLTTRILDAETAKVFLTNFCAAVGNYDLKEDVVDYRKKVSFEEAYSYIISEQQRVDELISKQLFYMSADVRNAACLNQVYDFFERSIVT